MYGVNLINCIYFPDYLNNNAVLSIDGESLIQFGGKNCKTVSGCARKSGLGVKGALLNILGNYIVISKKYVFLGF